MSKRKRQHPHQHLVRLLEAVNVPPPKMWPGAADRSLARPDSVKFDYAQFASDRAPGKAKLKQFEDDFRKGPLGHIPDIHHWAMEEFWWHGIPGDDWHPMEAYLAWAGDRYPPPAQEQLRRWKEARIGFYEVGDVREGTVGLQEWNLAGGIHCGPPLRAITLNLGGVNAYRKFRGQITLTYVAPWAPAENLFCGMGYGMTVGKQHVGLAELLLGLRHAEIAARPYSWKVSREARDEYLREWRVREWHAWLSERLVFPFRVLLRLSRGGEFQPRTAVGLMPMDPKTARNMGIYLEVPADVEGKELVLAGLTVIVPAELESPNWLPIAEYVAYRERAGPPPATRGQPEFMRLR